MDPILEPVDSETLFLEDSEIDLFGLALLFAPFPIVERC